MFKKFFTFQAASLVVLLAGFPVQAATFDSTGTGGNWSSPATWTFTGTDTNANGIPDSDEDVNILSGDTVTRDNGDLTTSGAYTMVVDGTLTMGTNRLRLNDGSSLLQINSGGVINAADRIDLISSGTNMELNGGSINLTGTFTGGMFSLNENTTWDVNSGTINVLNVNLSTLASNNTALNLLGTWDQSGGTVVLDNTNADGRAIVANDGGANRTINLFFSGTASLDAEGLQVENTSNNVTIHIEGSDVAKVDFDHFFMANSSFATQSGTVAFTFDEDGITPIELGNSSPFQGVASGTSAEQRFADYFALDIGALDAADGLALQEYTLFDFSGSGFDPSADLQGMLDFSGFGTFGSVVDANDGDLFTFQSGGSAQTIFYSQIKFDDSRVYLDVFSSTAVPEPSSVLLIGLGAALLARRLRERLAD